jgi:ribosome biogenesis GTPase
LEQRERYAVRAASGEYEAEITGNLRYSARGREDFPAVGDWVILTPVDEGFAVIHEVLPRHSVLKRRASDTDGEAQIIAANIDCALIVQSADRDFNLNRLERYLSICADAGIQSIVVITKTDLCGEEALTDLLARARARVGSPPVCALSNKSLLGLDSLKSRILPGRTYCLLGSSGVGKSTLLNNLCGRDLMKTGETSESTSKGRHTTSHRELLVMPGGGILIDNPGMREVGVTDGDSGMDLAFPAIAELSRSCRFSDCTHTCEKGCAVLDALRRGALDDGLYRNFLKMERERRHFEATAEERHKRSREFGKMLKTFDRDRKAGKF